ncbi:cyclase family protein [Rhodocaloribacter sp.]
MTLTVTAGNRTYRVDLADGIDLALPLDFHGPQPNAYGVPRAEARTYEDGGFVGDVRRGGGCNFEEYRLIPHCHGTHTEGVGHIAARRIPVHTILDRSLFPATLVTLAPEDALASGEAYDPAPAPADRFLTRAGLEAALEDADPDFLEALVIRTLPNDPDKRFRDYMRAPPPFFSLDAMRFVVNLGVRHLLLDLPSVDRTFDEGKLSAHHVFWGVPQGSHEVDARAFSRNTITEMIFVDDAVPDGRYLLSLHVAPFVADAAPSRPWLFPLRPVA